MGVIAAIPAFLSTVGGAAAGTTSLGTALAGAASIGGLGVSAYGAYSGAKAQNASLDYNASTDMRNAEYATQQAAEARAAGEKEEKQQRLRASLAQGQARAAMGASGVSGSQGSALDFIGDQAMYAEDDALTIRANTDKNVFGYNQQASNYQEQARMTKKQKVSPFMATTNSLLSGFSSTPWAKKLWE